HQTQSRLCIKPTQGSASNPLKALHQTLSRLCIKHSQESVQDFLKTKLTLFFRLTTVFTFFYAITSLWGSTS
ncbi:MAG: hypothetical protein SNJ09_08485, partial [Rikenellaceae bacterium]